MKNTNWKNVANKKETVRNVLKKQLGKAERTRMHSCRMRMVRCSGHLSEGGKGCLTGGGVPAWGVSAQGGVSAWGGVCCPGGVCLGGVFLGGVCRGVSARGCLPDTPLWTE